MKICDFSTPGLTCLCSSLGLQRPDPEPKPSLWGGGGSQLRGEPVLWASLSLSPGPCLPPPMLFTWGIKAGVRAFPGWKLGSQLGWGSPLGPWS